MNPPYEQRAILVNLPGLGRSPPAGPALLHYADAIATLFDELKLPVETEVIGNGPSRCRGERGRRQVDLLVRPRGGLGLAGQPGDHRIPVEVVSLDDGRPLGHLCRFDEIPDQAETALPHRTPRRSAAKLQMYL